MYDSNISSTSRNLIILISGPKGLVDMSGPTFGPWAQGPAD